MRVNEIYYCLSGEGIHQGIPTVLVRLQGCNLTPFCDFCDTPYAQSTDSRIGMYLEVEEIVEWIERETPQYIEWILISGGEPLWQQEELPELVEKLKLQGHKMEIETNGSFSKPAWWKEVDSWSADIKCPSSGVCGVSEKEEWLGTREQDQVKFVVGEDRDLEFVRHTLANRRNAKPTVLVSPVISKGDSFVRETASFCLEENLRLSLQWHKFIYGDKRRV